MRNYSVFVATLVAVLAPALAAQADDTQSLGSVNVNVSKCESADGNNSSQSWVLGSTYTLSTADLPQGAARKSINNEKGELTLDLRAFSYGSDPRLNATVTFKAATGEVVAGKISASRTGGPAILGVGACEKASDVGSYVIMLGITPPGFHNHR